MGGNGSKKSSGSDDAWEQLDGTDDTRPDRIGYSRGCGESRDSRDRGGGMSGVTGAAAEGVVRGRGEVGGAGDLWGWVPRDVWVGTIYCRS